MGCVPPACWPDPDGTPLDLDRIQLQTQTNPPSTQMELRLDKQTPVKTLPCPKLRLRTVFILWWKFHWVACWGVSGFQCTNCSNCSHRLSKYHSQVPTTFPKRQNQPLRWLYEPPINEMMDLNVQRPHRSWQKFLRKQNLTMFNNITVQHHKKIKRASGKLDSFSAFR